MTLSILKVMLPYSGIRPLRDITALIAHHQHLDPGDIYPGRVAAWIIREAMTDPEMRARLNQLLQDAGLLPAEGEAE